MATDWTARDNAIKYFECMLSLAKRHRHDEAAHYEQALNALRRSADHTAIQTKLNEAMRQLKGKTETQEK